MGLEAHGGTQVNNIYEQVGFGSLVRSNGYATVESSDAGSPLFTYAAEADNKSGDLILIVGAQDVAAPPGFDPPTATATTDAPALRPGHADADTNVAGRGRCQSRGHSVRMELHRRRRQWLDASGEGRTNVPAPDPRWRSSGHNRARIQRHPLARDFGAGTDRGRPAKTVTFTPNSGQLGDSFFSCDQSSCGSGHNNMLGTIKVVNPADRQPRPDGRGL